MTLFARQRSRAWRVRIVGEVVDEQFGPLHRRGAMLEWGSITKTATAAIAHRLADTDLLRFTDPVLAHLPDAGLPEIVTVRSLVEHYSGLRRMPSRSVAGRYSSADPFAVFTTEFFDDRVVPRLEHERTGPYGRHWYSNLGYAVLVRILEKATGRTWWDLARDLVFSPMAITDVGVDPTDPRVPELRTLDGTVRTHWALSAGPFVGAGGLIGTFDALESYAIASQRAAPKRDRMLGWSHGSGFWWHDGQVRDHGAWVGVDDAATRVITTHAIGHLIGAADATAMRLRGKYRYA